MDTKNTKNARRHFLKWVAQTGLASTSIAAIPASIAKALSIAPRSLSKSIQDVRHVVIFMQENRSFDHYFGCLKGVRGFGDPRPIYTRQGKPIWQQAGEYGRFQLPFPLGAGNDHDPSFDRSQCLPKDLPHNWKYSQKMWAYHDVWVREKGSMSMGYLSRKELPFYYALADAFTIGDAYYASVFGPTDPNRMFLFSGTNGVSVGRDGRHALSNVDDGNETSCMSRDKQEWKSPYLWTSYAERLSQHQISWKVYQEYDNYGDNSLAYFPQFRNLNLDDPLQKDRYQRGRSYAGETAQLDTKGLPLNTSAPDAQTLVDSFAQDVRSGNLPAVSWIVAPSKFSEHPDRSPPGYGESLTARLLNVLTEDPTVWAQTVLILCYDEDGGFFDHLPPPIPPSSRDQGYSTVSTEGEISAGEAFGLGARLPVMAISPWSRGGYVCSEVFDHTSILRFLEQRFGVVEPNISAWRRHVCGDLTSMFDFQQQDNLRPEQLFSTPHQQYIENAQRSCRSVKSNLSLTTNALPQQERDASDTAFSNTRPARALNYLFEVDGVFQKDADCFSIQFSNSGQLGAVFTVYPNGHNTGPWYYTIGSQKSFTETWSLHDFASRRYALRVFGPNGFMREFQGQQQHQVEVQIVKQEGNVGVVDHGKVLKLRLLNNGLQTQTILITDTFYGATEQRIQLAPMRSQILYLNQEKSFGWYDIQVRLAEDKVYLRRFAGHLETAFSSRSDPANGKFFVPV